LHWLDRIYDKEKAEMELKPVNFLLAGVGGQGTLLSSDIVAELGMHLGYDAKKSEVHGMAQRGGAVVSHVRWGERVASPLCEKGTVDYFVAQESLEALRWLDYLKPGGTMILSQQTIPPTGTVFGNEVYPGEEQVLAEVGKLAGKILLLNAGKIAEELGNRRVANSVLLGALSAEMDVDPEDWLAVIETKVPERHKEVNHKAFNRGREGQWELQRNAGTS
jgi:indolepyruvate ferredoxin oxidoreductase beta subunit